MSAAVAAPDHDSWTDRIGKEVAAKLVGLLEARLRSRAEFYAAHPEKIPVGTQASREAIITNTANLAGALSGGLNLIPGPAGLVVIVPELLKVIDLQIGMVYDLALAHGKQKQLSKELLMSILLAGSGIGASALAVQAGSKLLVKQATLRVMESVARQFSATLTQKAIGSTISRFLPMAGPLAMAAWTRYSTRELGAKALAILSRDIEVEEAEVVAEVAAEETLEEEVTVEVARLHALIVLAGIDGKPVAQEETFLRQLIDDAGLSERQRAGVLEVLETHRKVVPDFSVLALSTEESIRCLVDMVALAGKDGVFHPAERLYIRKSGKALGMPDEDVEALMAMVELAAKPA